MAAIVTRQMNFNITNMLFFSINNTIHDTMHDYRDKDRWMNSIIQLNNFRGGVKEQKKQKNSKKRGQMQKRVQIQKRGQRPIESVQMQQIVEKMHIDMQFNAFDLNLSNPGLNMFNMTIRNFLSLDYNDEAYVLFSLLDQTSDVITIEMSKTKILNKAPDIDKINKILIQLTQSKSKIISLYLDNIYFRKHRVSDEYKKAAAKKDIVNVVNRVAIAAARTAQRAARAAQTARAAARTAARQYVSPRIAAATVVSAAAADAIAADAIADAQRARDANYELAAAEDDANEAQEDAYGYNLEYQQFLTTNFLLDLQNFITANLIKFIYNDKKSVIKGMKGGVQYGTDNDLSSANNDAIISLIDKAIAGNTPRDLLSTYYDTRNGKFKRIKDVNAYIPNNLKLNTLIEFLSTKNQSAMVAYIKTGITTIVTASGQNPADINFSYRQLLTTVKTYFTQYKAVAEARELAAAQAAQAAAAQAASAQAAVAAQKAAEAAALAVAGNWSNIIHGSLKENFLQTFIKMGLINHKVYNFPANTALPDEDLPMNPFFSNLRRTVVEEELLMAQIKILLSSSDLRIPENTVATIQQYQNWNQLLLHGNNLDDKLYNYFADKINTVNLNNDNFNNDNNQSIQVKAAHNNMQFIVNNAAPLPEELKRHEFCPLSSRKDGQPNCNEQSATITETGIMNFTIKNTDANAGFPVASLFYRGQSRQYQLVAGAPGLTTRYDINLSFGTYADGSANITNMQQDLVYNGKELTAAQAIKMTLQKFWNFTQGAQGAAVHAAVIAQIAAAAAAAAAAGGAAAAAAAGGAAAATFGYFDLFYRLSYNTPAARAEFQECMYNILFKNTGDLFQEINAVCKFGGYINNAANPIRYDGNIIQWSPVGDAKRLFLAQDQPSACRFIFLKKYGVPAETNSGAFGGFWGQEKKMIYYHGGANAQEYAGGRNSIQMKTKKKRLIRQTKKRMIIRKKQRQTKKRNQ